MTTEERWRKRLSRKARETKLMEWERHARRLGRGKTKIPWDRIPDADAETIAIDCAAAEHVIKILSDHKVTFWQLGPLDGVCGRMEHSG